MTVIASVTAIVVNASETETENVSVIVIAIAIATAVIETMKTVIVRKTTRSVEDGIVTVVRGRRRRNAGRGTEMETEIAIVITSMTTTTMIHGPGPLSTTTTAAATTTTARTAIGTWIQSPAAPTTHVKGPRNDFYENLHSTRVPILERHRRCWPTSDRDTT
jgi:hypothetical protein